MLHICRYAAILLLYCIGHSACNGYSPLCYPALVFNTINVFCLFRTLCMFGTVNGREFFYGCLLSINKACTTPEACSVIVLGDIVCALLFLIYSTIFLLYSDSVVYFVFLLYFGTVLTVVYFVFLLYCGTVLTGIFCFSFF